ncbi:MAG: hypothetical protein ABSC02_15165 [Acidobacteriota bacterium]|jgi:hypothetical protein
MSARAAHVRERPAISDQLLSGIGDMGAQGGEKIERRDDMRPGGIGRAQPVMIPRIEELAIVLEAKRTLCETSGELQFAA